MYAPIDGRLDGRICLVTGGTAGIGEEAAHQLAELGGHVLLAARDPARGAASRARIMAATGNPNVEMREVDLSSQASIRRFASALIADHPRLDVLVNNAGIVQLERAETEDGIERLWATNVLAYHLVTELLLPALRAAPQGRIIHVASGMAYGLDLDDVEFRRRPYAADAAYAQSKQADRMLAWGLAKRLAGTHATVNAMTPGPVETGLLRSLFPTMPARTVAQGADTIAWLAAAKDVASVSGRYFADRTAQTCSYRDPQQIAALERVCREMTGT